MPSPGPGPAPGPVPDAPEEWHRVHPISPLVRGWIAVLAFAFIFGRDWFEGLFTGEPVFGLPAELGDRLPWAIGIILLALLLVGGGFFLSWYFTRYQVTEEHVKVNSGIVFRQSRQARLDRVQAIDVVQPFLARVFSLAELKFEVADAGESAVRLAFLRLGEARQLRATILARAAGLTLDPARPDVVPEAPEHQILELRPGRVLGAAVLSGATVLLLAAILAAGAAAVFWQPLSAAAVVPVVIAVLASYWSVFSTGFNFHAAISPDGIRLRYGLLDTRAQTVPPGRVQAVAITQSPLWRIAGWYKMQVNVAGYGLSAENSGRTTLLPVGTREEVMQMLALVLPDPGTADPVAVFTAGLQGRNHDGGFVTTPRRARWLAPISWRRNGFAVTGTALLIRSGVFWRGLDVVPHERIQSMALHQGPLARLCRVADLVLHSTPGPVSPRVIQAGTDAALRLFDEQAERARQARRLHDRDHWLETPPALPPVVEGARPVVEGARNERVETERVETERVETERVETHPDAPAKEDQRHE
jgi:putative membrane protein